MSRYLHRHGYTNELFTEGDEITVNTGERYRVRGIHWDADSLIVSPIESRATSWDKVVRISVSETESEVVREAPRKCSGDIPMDNPSLLVEAPGHLPVSPEEALARIEKNLPEIRAYGSGIDLERKMPGYSEIDLKVTEKNRVLKIKVKARSSRKKVPVRLSVRGGNSLHITDVVVKKGRAKVVMPLPEKGRRFQVRAISLSDPGASKPVKVKL